MHATARLISALTLGGLLAAGCSAVATPVPVAAPDDRATTASRVYCERLAAVDTMQEFTDVQIRTRSEYPDLFDAGLAASCPQAWQHALQATTADPELADLQRSAEQQAEDIMRQNPGLYANPPSAAEQQRRIDSGMVAPGAGYEPGSPKHQTCVADPTNALCGG